MRLAAGLDLQHLGLGQGPPSPVGQARAVEVMASHPRRISRRLARKVFAALLEVEQVLRRLVRQVIHLVGAGHGDRLERDIAVFPVYRYGHAIS